MIILGGMVIYSSGGVGYLTLVGESHGGRPPSPWRVEGALMPAPQ